MMNIEKIREICLAKPLVTEDTPFGPEFVAFRFFDKIFCCIDLERPHLVTMKCDPDRAVSLRDAYPEITGAWHWNKRMWNDVRLDGQVPDALIVDLIDHAYDEVRKKLPKKTLYHFPDLPQGWTHTHLPEVDSTMNVVRAYPPLPDTSVEAGPTVEPTRFELLTADFQTAGRGQRGSHWEADDRQNLLFSFRFCPSPLIQPCHHFMLSECLALAVAKALKQYIAAGMTHEQISSMREFEEELFRQERVYENRINVGLPDLNILRFSVEEDYFQDLSHHLDAALEDMQPGIAQRITEQDRKVLLLACFGFTQDEIAVKLHMKQSTVSYHLDKLKKLLKMVR